MFSERPPSIDATAARQWLQRTPDTANPTSPWLHEEVARRMEARLSCIVATPQSWVHWQPLQGGLEAHRLLQQRYPQSACYVMQDPESQNQIVRQQLRQPWWRVQRWRNTEQYCVPTQPTQMLWANMALHLAAEPLQLLQRWNQLLAVDGFVMVSCLGPDTLVELRQLYRKMGWPPPAHEFTDMHDWGDMLVQAGFAEPVMDMERIRLSYSNPANLLQELRQLGRNLHVNRAASLRGRAWKDGLYQALSDNLQDTEQDGRLSVTFEIIYGHAFKPAPRIKLKPETTFSLEQMQSELRKGSQGPQRFVEQQCI